MEVEVSFHLPEAAQHFIKGLFQWQVLDLADKKSRVCCEVLSVEALPNPFTGKKDNEIMSVQLDTASACIAGIKNEKGNYNFLSPDDERFAENLLYNWREKIRAVFGEAEATESVLVLEVMQKPHTKSRLITIKAGTPEETKVRGFVNLSLKVMGEKRFVEMLWNVGAGLYNSFSGFLKVKKATPL